VPVELVLFGEGTPSRHYSPYYDDDAFAFAAEYLQHVIHHHALLLRHNTRHTPSLRRRQQQCHILQYLFRYATRAVHEIYVYTGGCRAECPRPPTTDSNEQQKAVKVRRPQAVTTKTPSSSHSDISLITPIILYWVSARTVLPSPCHSLSAPLAAALYYASPGAS